VTRATGARVVMKISAEERWNGGRLDLPFHTTVGDAEVAMELRPNILVIAAHRQIGRADRGPHTSTLE
jgi:hypothetical protein